MPSTGNVTGSVTGNVDRRHHALITLVDIAREAGCSVNTVSRALNNKPDVNPETRVRVLAVAQQLGYVPNVLAKSLVTRKTQTLGLVITDPLYPNYVTLFGAVDDVAGEHAYSVLLSTSKERLDKERKAIGVLMQRRVDGLLVVPVGPDAEHLESLRSRNLPCVLLLRNPSGPRMDFVGSDEVAAGADAVNHLLALGHRRIGFLAEKRGILTVTARLRGYRGALVAAGITPSPEWELTVPFSVEGAYQGIKHLLGLSERPTALLLQSDLLAPGVFAAAREAGLRIPDDLALVGSGDHYFSPFLEVPLTTMRRPVANLGAMAVQLLLERIADPDGEPRQIIIPSTLVIRRSCGAKE